MKRLLVLAALVLGICLPCTSWAGAEDAHAPAHVANLQVVDIDVQLFPVFLIGMEVPVVTVTVRNAGTAPAPAFSVDTRVSYYGTDAGVTVTSSSTGLAPGATQTFSFELTPEIVGVRDPHGITSIANAFPGELPRIDNRRFEILDF